MGQYHKLVNLDKGEYVSPHGLGLGLKQYEHFFGDGTLPQAQYLLTMTSPANSGSDLPQLSISGRWAGDRVVILGDYTNHSELPLPPFVKEKDFYEKVTDTWLDISAEVAQELGKLFNFSVQGDGWKERVNA